MSKRNFEVTELTEFAKNFIDKCSKDYPKEVKRFLRAEGNKLKRKIKQEAELAFGTEHMDEDKKYRNRWKRGNPYKFNVDEDAVRVYNSSPHAHLLEYGHRMVTKSGKEVGFVRGNPITEKESKKFENKFTKDIEKFVDELLNEGLT